MFAYTWWIPLVLQHLPALCFPVLYGFSTFADATRFPVFTSCIFFAPCGPKLQACPFLADSICIPVLYGHKAHLIMCILSVTLLRPRGTSDHAYPVRDATPFTWFPAVFHLEFSIRPQLFASTHRLD